ncbi:MAG: Rpn family recombination-promoting nuclease/putative transposase [Bacteroidales bacterium]|jgi:hypothetical protein|nr:Rpn family recombination-promoting nuclease/putative transposase [Bacteroidales bacterium]
MARYLDLQVDLVFKKNFGENPDLTISFLNAPMPLSKGQEIKEIQYLATEQDIYDRTTEAFYHTYRH